MTRLCDYGCGQHQWELYVLATKVLTDEVPEQKTISLAGLSRLGAKKVGSEDLRKAVEAAAATR